jgi:hypothetical protein
LAAIIYKPKADFELTVSSRIKDHQEQECIKAEQAAKAQAEREEQIRLEAEEKAKREERARIEAEQEKEHAAQKAEQEKSNTEAAENPSTEQNPVFNKEIQGESKVVKGIETTRLPSRNQIISALMSRFGLSESEAVKAISLAFPAAQ